MLGVDLGLPIMEPFFVLLEQDFIDAIAEAPVRTRLTPGHLCFGSTLAGNQFQLWENFNKVADAQIAAASSIVAFDAFIGNPDRRPRNPNLLVRGYEWRLIDHGDAFMFRTKLFPPCRPWVVGNLEPMRDTGADSEHVFASHLKGRVADKLEHIGTAWRGLTDLRLAAYDATLPEEWDEVRGPFGEAIEHLKHVRDNIDECLAELERVLS